VSSRDVSGSYGPPPRGAGDYDGRSWQDRPAGRGSSGRYGGRHGGYAAAEGGYARDGRPGGRSGQDDRGYGQPSGGYRPRGNDYSAATGGYTGNRRRPDGYGTGDDYVRRGRGERAQGSPAARRDGDYSGRPGRPGSPGPTGRSGQYGQDRAAGRGRADQWSDGYGPGDPGRGGYSGGRGGSGRGGNGGPGGPRGRDGGGAGGRGPGRGKVKGSWWRRWTWRKVLGVTAAGFGGLVLLGVAGVGYAYATTTVPTDASQAAMQQQSTVYFNDGKTVVGTFGSTNRQVLQYDQIPAVMRDATLAAEDRSFYTEGGVSPTGIMRAAYEDVFHGGGSQGSLAGGSTITQEFVRGYYSNIGTQQTISRKVKEIFVALKVAKEKSKAWILTQYLNTIYLGQGAYGIGAAAETYFGEPASKLTVAQAAELAAIIQSPSYYPTQAGHQALVARWHYVLTGLVKMGDLTPAQAAAEKFPQANSADQQHVGSDPYDPYILEVVRNELESVYKYTPAQIDNGGLRIVTTLDKNKMNALYSAVNQNEQQMAEGGMGLPSWAHVGAVLQNPQNGAIEAMYPGPGQNMSARRCMLYKCDLDTAIYTREQVGSSFKPYVLATAVRQGMNVQTSTLDGDSPLWIPPESQPNTLGSTSPMPAPYYEVTNDSSDGSQGPVTVLKATAMSLNTAYTDLIHKVGGQNVVNLAQQMGVDPKASGLDGDIANVGMALGQDSLSVDEQASMLATLDDNGTYHDAHVIQQITQGTTVYPAKITSRQVLTPTQDSQVQYAMSADTVAGGTATAAAMNDGRPIIGKTGTTNDAQSAFFIGAIPQDALAVGIFSNDQTGDNKESLNGLGGSMASGGFGGYWPAKIWHTFAEAEFAQLPIQQFPAPQFSGQAWNMMGQGVTANPAPAQTQQTKPTTRPTAPATTNPTAPSSNPSPNATPSGQPTCDPFSDANCPGNGGGGGTGNGGPGNGNGAGGGPANGTAGFVVTLVPMAWLTRRRRKRG